jgi:hypothetical protein
MVKDKYSGYFKTKGGKYLYKIHGECNRPRWRFCDRFCTNNINDLRIGDYVSCDFLRLHCIPISEKEYKFLKNK